MTHCYGVLDALIESYKEAGKLSKLNTESAEKLKNFFDSARETSEEKDLYNWVDFIVGESLPLNFSKCKHNFGIKKVERDNVGAYKNY